MLASALLIPTIYIIGLFYIAWQADKRYSHTTSRHSGLMYGLSLGVYFTSWTFFGAVGTAARSGWDFLPIYIGPFLLMTVGFPIVRRMIELGRSFHSTSIADFLSTRYGKSGGLAALVTFIAVTGVIPYIALQLRSVSMSFSAIVGRSSLSEYDLVPLAAALLAGFAILFGTRHVDTTVHKRGLVSVVSLETAVKLFALLMVAAFALSLYTTDELIATMTAPTSPFVFEFNDRFVTLTVISMVAILCLPRQFHLMVVECQHGKDIQTGRWVFLASLAITVIVVVPITLAGIASNVSGSPDLYVLTLPLAEGANWLALLVFLGGVSAATGMVIVSTVALATMVTNDLLFGALLRRTKPFSARDVVGGQAHIMVRRLVIFSVLALATLYHLGVKESDTLANLGILSFAAVTHFAPALIGGLYWPRGHKSGVVAGLSIGFLGWLFLLMAPTYFGPDYHTPLILHGVDPLTSGIVISLTSNILFYIFFSYLAQPSVVDKLQAASFIRGRMPQKLGRIDYERGNITMPDLESLLERCLGRREASAALRAFEVVEERILPESGPADSEVIAFAERKIARVLGTASARILMRSVMTGHNVGAEDIATVLGEAQEKLQFSQKLLQSTLDNMNQSVSVIDKNLRLIAWNQRYLEMFNFPKGFIKVGMPIADVIRYNAQQGRFGPGNIDEFVGRRLDQFRQARPHAYERTESDGRTLQILGNPMPDGNYVTTFTDITEGKRIEQQLKSINETLEDRVAERTQALDAANTALREATRSKTRFLAAASHDLLQPLNAARLFASALKEDLGQATDPAKSDLMDKLDRSIQSADQLIRALLDISKLDAGGLTPTYTNFSLGEVLRDLTNEQSAHAATKGLGFTYIPTSVMVHSDRGLIISVLQNLISNAVRYTQEGRVLVGVRRHKHTVSVQVWDTGPGLTADEQVEIFKEFTRLKQPPDGPKHTSNQAALAAQSKGIGLGLAITQRIVRLLGVELAVHSKPGIGSLFEVTLKRAAMRTNKKIAAVKASQSRLAGLRVLCVDNDDQVLDAQTALLSRWGCLIETARTAAEARALYKDKAKAAPDMVLLDYQLDDDETGPGVYAVMVAVWGSAPPAIIITADRHIPDDDKPTPETPVLQKPLEPAALRILMERLLKGKSTTPTRRKPAKQTTKA